MTLILTVATTHYVLQVSDRLTTVGEVEHDKRANKTVIYRARDGLFAISYSGLAYLDNAPTDEWIASKLVGHQLPTTAALGGAPWRSTADIGLSLILLSDSLAASYRALPGKHRAAYWYTCAAGFQGSDPRLWEPIAYEITNRGPGGRCEFLWAPITPNPIPGDKFVLMQSPNVLTTDEVERLRAALRSTTSDQVDTAEQILVSAIQEVAARSSTVGENCMSVALSPQLEPRIRARFIPGTIEHAVPGEGALSGQDLRSFSGRPIVPVGVPVGYSPLMLGPHALNMPTVMLGSGFTFTFAGISVRLEGPEDRNARGFFIGTYSRQPPP